MVITSEGWILYSELWACAIEKHAKKITAARSMRNIFLISESYRATQHDDIVYKIEYIEPGDPVPELIS